MSTIEELRKENKPIGGEKMSTLEELRKENTAGKWTSLHYRYIATNEDFEVWEFLVRPVYKNNKWKVMKKDCVEVPFSRLNVNHPVARISMRIALEHGPEYSLLEQPTELEKFWEPELGEKYHIPTFYPSSSSSVYWKGRKSDLRYHKYGVVFKYAEHAKMVAKNNIDPMVLQAALAVGGLASDEQIFSKEERKYILHTFYDNEEGCYQWRWINTKYHVFPHLVNFKSYQKLQEALAVELPDGRTLFQYLTNQSRGEEQ